MYQIRVTFFDGSVQTDARQWFAYDDWMDRIMRNFAQRDDVRKVEKVWVPRHETAA